MPSRVRWYHSLIFRIILLCVVLTVCMFGAVAIIAHHYVGEIVSEMEGHTDQILRNVEVLLEANPDEDLTALQKRLSDDEIDIEFDNLDEAVVPMHVTLERLDDGRIDKVARTTFAAGDRRILLTVRVPLLAQTEIVRTFTKPYIALVSAVFLVALGLMIYFIVKILRPISELSESCSRISQGELADVTIRRNSGEILALENVFNRMVAALREKETVEANLRQAQRLSALGTLAAGVAHDVRNPLNSIKLLSGHAEDAVGDGPAAKHLKTIREQVDRLDEIVTGFLSLAKERELQPEPCRVDALLTECLRLVQQDAETRGIRLVSELRAGDTELLLDAKQFTRAVLNVVLNGLEACPAGGRVRLFSRLTDVACEIEIRDDGPGVPRAEGERVFDPYFTTKPTGTGLGLSITRGIVEEHGGTISFASSEGQGTQVLITLPLEVKTG